MPSIAHVGYGYWGSNIARDMAALGYLAAIVDGNPEAARQGAEKLGVRAASFEAVLADPAIAAVTIASPAELHFEQARAALLAGKHVLVEKPLALEAAEGEALCKLAEERNLRLMVGHLLQYHPVFLKLGNLAATGTFGELLHVYSNRLSMGKFRREENVLWSFAPHDLSMILSLMGREPETVTAQGTDAFTPGIADLAIAQLSFAGGGRAHVLVSWMHPFKEQRLVVIGRAAMAVFEDSETDWDRKLRIYRHVIDSTGPVPVPTKAEPDYIAVPRGDPLKEECRHFIECIETGAAPRTDGREALAVLKVLQRAEAELSRSIAAGSIR